VLVSDTVRDIVAGSTLTFADRDTYKLKGIEGSGDSSPSCNDIPTALCRNAMALGSGGRI
jgi:hypothetical protein